MLEINKQIGTSRERIDETEAEWLRREGLLVEDERLRRTLFFDGLFLTADNLTNEQLYFLTRQADLGQASGTGIVNGLRVAPGANETTLTIEPGLGITPSGDMVALTAAPQLTIDLAELADQQRLDNVFGLSLVPRPSPVNLTGLFILGLRPVEYTTNQVASYPTTLTGERSTHDGDIVEATAVSLIPFAEGRSIGELDIRRSAVAYDLFVAQNRPKLPNNFLPLSIVAMNRGFLVWVDDYLIRRELGAEQSDILGMGFAPRASREAFFLQYQNHLNDVLSTVGNQSFAASRFFKALPPAGEMPAQAINPADFTQTYFPAEVEVQFSIIPDDEIGALIEESLLLPPIDLTLSGPQLESTSVLVLLPVPRRELGNWQTSLQNRLTRTLRTAAPGVIYRRKPLETLLSLKARRFPIAFPTPAETLDDDAWRSALSRFERLWYIRRRNLAYREDIVGLISEISVPPTTIEIPPIDEIEPPVITEPPIEPAEGDPLEDDPNILEADEALTLRMRGYGLKMRYDQLRTLVAADAVNRMIDFLLLPKFLESKMMIWSAMVELDELRKSREEQFISRRVIRLVTARYRRANSDGTRVLAKANDDLETRLEIVRILSFSGTVTTIDRIGVLALRTDNRPFIQEVAKELVEIAESFLPFNPENATDDELSNFREQINLRIRDLLQRVS